MEQPNPYGAPKAPVAMPVAATPRPARVNRALALLWAALAVAGLSAFESSQDVALQELLPLMGIMTVLLFAASATLIWLIGRRHNWARIMNLVLTLLALPLMFFGIGEDSPSRPIGDIADWLSMALELVAMYLLFSRESAAWFRPSA